jgi:uncharacterized membrane protein YkoI
MVKHERDEKMSLLTRFYWAFALVAILVIAAGAITLASGITSAGNSNGQTAQVCPSDDADDVDAGEVDDAPEPGDVEEDGPDDSDSDCPGDGDDADDDSDDDAVDDADDAAEPDDDDEADDAEDAAEPDDDDEADDAEDAAEPDDDDQADDADDEGETETEEAGDVEDDAEAPGQIDDGADLLPQAGISLEAAIAAAQAAAEGTVGEIDLETFNGTLVFNVEIGDHDVKVDAQTGAVLASDLDD